MRNAWIACVCAALVVGCAGQAEVVSRSQPAAPVARGPQVAEGLADLYLFNISGWTLIPSNQDIAGNGRLLASLPRRTYTVVRLPSGTYDLRLHGRKLIVDVEGGKKYFVAAGYRPERSWALPLAGDPVEIKQITEDQARPLLQQLTAQ
jgi:hypothetical protein